MLVRQRIVGAAVALMCAAAIPESVAQQPVRASLAGEAAARGRTQVDAIDYNILAGPVRLKLNGRTEVEFNDNVNVASPEDPIGPEADLFLRPGLDLAAVWQVTRLNRLNLRVGLGYEFSINDTRDGQTSPFTLSPDSELGFDLFVGDFRINLHDRFAVENNPASQATLSNTSGYTRFTNQAGVSVLWDLNDLVIGGGYDFVIERYKGGDFQLNNRDSHQIHLSATAHLNETTTAGAQSSLALATYKDREGLEQRSWTGGPFLQFQLTPYTRVLLAGGIHYVDGTGEGYPVGAESRLEDGSSLAGGLSSNGGGSDLGYYWTAGIFNRLNSAYTHSLSSGHEQQVGLGLDVVEIDYARYEGAWQINQQLTLAIGIAYEHYKDVRGSIGEQLDRWHFSLAFGYRLTQRLGAGFRYSHLTKDSEVIRRDYRQNVASVSLSYDF